MFNVSYLPRDSTHTFLTLYCAVFTQVLTDFIFTVNTVTVIQSINLFYFCYHFVNMCLKCISMYVHKVLSTKLESIIVHANHRYIKNNRLSKSTDV